MGRSLRLLVQGTPDSARIALLDETRLLEFYQEDTGAQSLVGSVFLGRVERVLPDVKAAFVKLGLRQNGFLPLREAESYHRTSGSASLMTGQDVLVQVKKDPKGEKGAFLTRDISLPGQYVLLMPRNRFVGLSRRMTVEEDRARAQALGRRIADGRFGLIVRHAALFAPVAEVEAEAEALWESWRETEERARYCKAPALLHEEPPMLSVLLRDYAARHPIEVLSRLEPPEALPQGVTWQTLTAVEMEAAWSAARVEKQVDEALSRRVPLPGGGSLIIDEREALTTIDVNSGSTVTAADGETLAVEENLRAAAAVVLIGAKPMQRGLAYCSLCGFASCAACREAGGRCCFDGIDLGIALGSAVSAAADERVDSRIMYTIGKAAEEMGYEEGPVIWHGIPLSVTGKSPFFDRKT